MNDNIINWIEIKCIWMRVYVLWLWYNIDVLEMLLSWSEYYLRCRVCIEGDTMTPLILESHR